MLNNTNVCTSMKHKIYWPPIPAREQEKHRGVGSGSENANIFHHADWVFSPIKTGIIIKRCVSMFYRICVLRNNSYWYNWLLTFTAYLNVRRVRKHKAMNKKIKCIKSQQEAYTGVADEVVFCCTWGKSNVWEKYHLENSTCGQNRRMTPKCNHFWVYVGVNDPEISEVKCTLYIMHTYYQGPLPTSKIRHAACWNLKPIFTDVYCAYPATGVATMCRE